MNAKKIRLVVFDRWGCPYRRASAYEENHGPGGWPRCEHPNHPSGYSSDSCSDGAHYMTRGVKASGFPRGCPLKDGDTYDRQT